MSMLIIIYVEHNNIIIIVYTIILQEVTLNKVCMYSEKMHCLLLSRVHILEKSINDITTVSILQQLFCIFKGRSITKFLVRLSHSRIQQSSITKIFSTRMTIVKINLQIYISELRNICNVSFTLSGVVHFGYLMVYSYACRFINKCVININLLVLCP